MMKLHNRVFAVSAHVCLIPHDLEGGAHLTLFYEGGGRRRFV